MARTPEVATVRAGSGKVTPLDSDCNPRLSAAKKWFADSASNSGDLARGVFEIGLSLGVLFRRGLYRRSAGFSDRSSGEMGDAKSRGE